MATDVKEGKPRKPPHENLFRAIRGGMGVRSNGDTGMPTLFGHFAVFNRWTEIDSWVEGHFLERIAPGAFKKTFSERTPKVLFQHGQDPMIGDKPLGPVEVLSEDRQGAVYEVPMLDTAYNRELVPGLEAGLYGASFRFKVMREEVEEEPGQSDANPRGLPQRTIREAQVSEFGPVTFPAYAEASADVRSLNDHFLFAAIERDPTRARELLQIGGAAALMRMDTEDLGTVAAMIQMGTDYVAEQDETDDAANVPVMENVLALLAELVAAEVVEDEPADDEGMMDEGMNAGRVDAATIRTSGTPDAAVVRTSIAGEPYYLPTKKEKVKWQL